MPFHDAIGFWPMLPVGWFLLAGFLRFVLAGPRRPGPRPITLAPPLPRPLPPRQDLRERWLDARQRYRTTAIEYAAYECDPLQVLRLPALADPDVATTRRFITAFHEAMALHTDDFPPPGMAEKFIVAAAAAAQSWHAAKAAAENLRASRFTTDERAMITQGIKLLELAAVAATPAEQEAAYSAARQVLARLERSTTTRMEWRLPHPAHAEIQRHASPQLPPGPSSH